jgi:dipeptidyl aminopeptidase/acylaminoacyl peptidase
MKNFLLALVLVAAVIANLFAQDPSGYQTPPSAITQLVDAPNTPTVSISPDGKWMLLMEQPGYPSIDEVAQPELRLAGLRINPRTNGPSRSNFTTGLSLKSIDKGRVAEIKRMPPSPKIQYTSWSPDGSTIAFVHTTNTGMELWTIDVATATAKIHTSPSLNGAMPGAPYTWLDNKSIIAAMIPNNRGAAPTTPTAPAGPVIQANEGKAAPVRTFQDLLSNPHDEALFEHYANTQLMLINIAENTKQAIGNPGLIFDFSPSPDGKFLLVTTLQKPFSYIVPASRFPQKTEIWTTEGQVIRVMAQKPLMDNLPQGFDAVPTGPRSFTWRADAPATLYWVEAQDEGNPRKEAAIRDKMFFMSAPFSGVATEALSFTLRFRGVIWGTGNLAVATEGWRQNRRQITSSWSPDKPADSKAVLFDRSTEDRYNDPGNFVTKNNKYGRNVLLLSDTEDALFLTGQGASPEGNRPFLDRFELKTQQSKRLWNAQAPYYEVPVAILDAKKGSVITRRESTQEPPNYFLNNIYKAESFALTNFENPYSALSSAYKEIIRYKRSDGVELTGTLYLPAGYNKEKDGPLPVLMWAYPREFKSADAAGQVSGSPYQFIRLSWGSPLYWLTQGYAVFDDFSMPIIGEGDAEPNETFVSQLKDNAESAINTLVAKGVADRNKIAVGGHSYGAFMTANLLAHTDLFAAGIARSGAYNRTLTPFGFQSEERSYWEAPEVYFNMSPFNFADKIKTPILLIHGEADNNSGTFPIQSERFYAALKGHGATARYVVLPAESHGYRARESVLHTLWEMNQWLDKHVKNRISKP